MIRPVPPPIVGFDFVDSGSLIELDGLEGVVVGAGAIVGAGAEVGTGVGVVFVVLFPELEPGVLVGEGLLLSVLLLFFLVSEELPYLSVPEELLLLLPFPPFCVVPFNSVSALEGSLTML